MNLDENQKKQVARWLDEGLKLADVQKGLAQQFGLRLTYMEVKLLVAELDLKPKDPEPDQSATPALDSARGTPPAGPADVDDLDAFPEDEAQAGGPGGVKVTVDQIARPGAMISGKATFANGKTCEWILDQLGRLGLVPAADGYKPSQIELQEFQFALEDVLRKSGF